MNTVDLVHSLQSARANSDALFDVVCPGSLYERPIPERHRIVFYIGHLEAFDWNMFGRGGLDLAPFRPEFDHLFSFGIDPAPGNPPSDQPPDWPRLDEIRCYRDEVRDRLDEKLDRVPEDLLHVAIEHRLMHVETLAYMFHNLPHKQKVSQCQTPAPAGGTPENPTVEVPAGTVRLGRDRAEGFGWDNEFEAHTVEARRFGAARYKVTNGEYLRFVDAGATAPHFWRQRDGQWFYCGMFEEIPLPLDWPVYVSKEEAERYSAWMGKRLPTEAEFHRFAYAGDAPDPARDNFDFYRWDPVPVTASGINSLGIAQAVGNGWEWTSTPFAPFPGFEPRPYYPGYSSNFFDGQHFVLKGASPRTAACMARPSFRNWFRPSYPYVYATFRVVGE